MNKTLIVNTIPPIYQTLHDKFKVEWDRGLVIAYFPNIHTKNGSLSPDLQAHERTHLYQQEKFPGGVSEWWKKYIDEPAFRLQEETMAYFVQVDYIKKNVIGRNLRRALIKHIVTSFVTMYGGIITKEQAKVVLKI